MGVGHLLRDKHQQHHSLQPQQHQQLSSVVVSTPDGPVLLSPSELGQFGHGHPGGGQQQGPSDGSSPNGANYSTDFFDSPPSAGARSGGSSSALYAPGEPFRPVSSESASGGGGHHDLYPGPPGSSSADFGRAGTDVQFVNYHYKSSHLHSPDSGIGGDPNVTPSK
jgi:hypothetical protein